MHQTLTGQSVLIVTLLVLKYNLYISFRQTIYKICLDIFSIINVLRLQNIYQTEICLMQDRKQTNLLSVEQMTTSISLQNLTFCCYEDRIDAIDGIKLLVMSLDKQVAGSTLLIYTSDEIKEQLLQWRPRDCNHLNIIFHDTSVVTLDGWCVKPSVLRDCLRQYPNGVTWLDSDIIILRDIAHIFDNLSQEDILVASEPGLINPLRTTHWGHKHYANVPLPINSSVLRVTDRHLLIINEWEKIIATEEFQTYQKKPFIERPPWAYSDQDVLEGLLCSEMLTAITSASIKQLKTGSDIIHSCTYGISDRIRNTYKSEAFFAHGQSIKPWHQHHIRKHRIIDVRMQLSPYFEEARKYAPLLGNPKENAWTEAASSWTRLLRAVSFGNVHLQGLPVEVYAHLKNRLHF